MKKSYPQVFWNIHFSFFAMVEIIKICKRRKLARLLDNKKNCMGYNDVQEFLIRRERARKIKSIVVFMFHFFAFSVCMVGFYFLALLIKFL